MQLFERRTEVLFQQFQGARNHRKDASGDQAAVRLRSDLEEIEEDDLSFQQSKFGQLFLRKVLSEDSES